MAKRELSGRLQQMKFMRRAKVKEDMVKKVLEEEEKGDEEHWVVPAAANGARDSAAKCVVLLEGDPRPGALLGRMSFQSFNPLVERLLDDAEGRPRREFKEAPASMAADGDANQGPSTKRAAPEEGQQPEEEGPPHKKRRVGALRPMWPPRSEQGKGGSGRDSRGHERGEHGISKPTGSQSSYGSNRSERPSGDHQGLNRKATEWQGGSTGRGMHNGNFGGSHEGVFRAPKGEWQRGSGEMNSNGPWERHREGGRGSQGRNDMRADANQRGDWRSLRPAGR